MRKVKVNFLLNQIFRGNLNEAISTNETVSFRFPRKIFLKTKLTFRAANKEISVANLCM